MIARFLHEPSPCMRLLRLPLSAGPARSVLSSRTPMATFPRPGARHGVYSASGRARSSNRCPDACIYRACRKGASRALLRHCRKGTNVHCLRESAGPFRDGGGQRVPPTNQPKQSKADRPTSSARLAHSRRAIRAMPTPVEVSVFRRKLAGHACMCSVLLDGNAEMRSCAVRGLVAAVLMPRGAASHGSMGTVGGPLGNGARHAVRHCCYDAARGRLCRSR